MEHVEIVKPESMNLLGLMLAHILEKNLSAPGGSERLRGKDSRLGIGAGDMRITLHMHDGGVSIHRGYEGSLSACVEGTMDAFLGFGVHRRMVVPYLSGKLKVKGNPFALLPLLWLTKL